MKNFQEANIIYLYGYKYIDKKDHGIKMQWSFLLKFTIMKS